MLGVLIGADQSRLEWNQSSVSSTNLAVKASILACFLGFSIVLFLVTSLAKFG